MSPDTFRSNTRDPWVARKICWGGMGVGGSATNSHATPTRGEARLRADEGKASKECQGERVLPRDRIRQGEECFQRGTICFACHPVGRLALDHDN